MMLSLAFIRIRYSLYILTNKNLIISPDGTQTQEELCWQGPAAIYCYAVLLLFAGM
jgi:hypothetical protein